jgi:hypothetical protein
LVFAFFFVRFVRFVRFVFLSLAFLLSDIRQHVELP